MTVGTYLVLLLLLLYESTRRLKQIPIIDLYANMVRNNILCHTDAIVYLHEILVTKVKYSCNKDN